MKGDGSAAEAMAALALTQEGFDVALPVFKQPSFDMISNWGNALHAIQVKTGFLQPNGKTIQWKTTKRRGARLYEESDCTYFALVLVPRNEIWWLPFSEVSGKPSVCTNIERDPLAEYRGSLDNLKA
ncbi:MAG: group I intron-associated PD-(D/E)XK endonuclease [Verrucomicrobiota bacterium]|nr:group I intron-associated PD-(D/E)XK endonuclease [Verrucomicrobiota bacterium]